MAQAVYKAQQDYVEKYDFMILSEGADDIREVRNALKIDIMEKHDRLMVDLLNKLQNIAETKLNDVKSLRNDKNFWKIISSGSDANAIEQIQAHIKDDQKNPQGILPHSIDYYLERGKVNQKHLERVLIDIERIWTSELDRATKMNNRDSISNLRNKMNEPL